MNNTNNSIFDNPSVDRAHLCIDPNSELGKHFVALRKEIDAETDPDKKAFMSQIASYAEAALVIEQAYPDDRAKTLLSQLKQKFER